jgi:hypothetical protein
VIGQGFVSWHASRNCGSNYFEGEKMSFIKLAGGRLPMALVVLAASSQVALADTKTLICTPQNPNLLVISFDLDEAKSTVTVNYHSGAPSSGPLLATFSPNTVMVDHKMGAGYMGYHHFVIDRISGILLDYFGAGGEPYDQTLPENRAVQHYDCHVGKALF